MKNRDALSPRPSPGAVLALYKPPFSAWDMTRPEDRRGLVRVERVTRSGQITLAHPHGGRRYDATGHEIGGGSTKLHVRWPTAEDLVDHRRQFITNALLAFPWGRMSEEQREQAAAIVGIEVTDP